MISFRSFSLVLSVVLLRQLSLQTAGEAGAELNVPERPFNWLICGTVLFCVIAKFLPVFAMIRADTVGRAQGWREMEQNRGWLEWAWLATQSWLLAGSGAAVVLVSAEQQGWSPAIMLLAWFAPTFVFYAALEFGLTQLECLWSADGDQSNQAHWIRWNARVRLGALGNVVTCLLPVVILLGAVDVIQLVMPTLSELSRAILALVCLGCIGLTLTPLWLRLWSGAQSLPADHPIAERCAHLCRLMQIHAPQVCFVGQGQQWHGVALIGWTPLFRQLWIGAAVAQKLTAEQLDMVLLHELAHLKRGHCWWRIIPLTVSGIVCAAALMNLPLDSAHGVSQLLIALAFAASMIWMLSSISRRCEMDADRQACYVAAANCAWTDGQPGCAMNMLASALVVLHDPEESPTRSQWLHPSLAKRIAVKP